jgi:hypothetical protein
MLGGFHFFLFMKHNLRIDQIVLILFSILEDWLGFQFGFHEIGFCKYENH